MSLSDDIAQQMKELKATVESLQEKIAPAKAEVQHFADEEAAARQAYMDAVARIRNQKTELEQKISNTQMEVNRIQRELEAKERALAAQKAAEEKAAREEAAKAELEELNKRWETLTMGAPWREWAKQHQIDGGHKIVMDRNVIVADPMGLGKTLTSIIACDMAEAATRQASPEHPFLGIEKEQWVGTTWYDADGNKVPSYEYDPAIHTKVPAHYETVIVDAIERPVGKKILYFCPAALLKNVEREFRMWSKHRSVVILGGTSKAQRQFMFDMVLPQSQEYVVIVNYEAWRRDLSLLDSLVNLDFDTVIIDEAHNIKNQATSAFKGIKHVIAHSKPGYIMPMTGTPILNRPQELFPLLNIVNPYEFHTENDFLFNYCTQDQDTGQWKFKPGGLDLIVKKISKNFLRRTRDQAGIELPEKTVTFHNLEVDVNKWPNQAKVREQMRLHAIIMIDENKGKGIGAAAQIAVFNRLRQVETWPAGIKQKVLNDDPEGGEPIEEILQVEVEESQKLDYVISWNKEDKQWEGLIPEFIEDERGVLFSQFSAPLYEIEDRLKRMGKRPVVLNGQTPRDLRDEILIDFDNRHTPDRSKARWDIVLCNYKVGGVGANMTAATQMVILDEEWNPGKRDQAYDRIHRIGQDKPVTIHVVRNGKTIDDWLANIMENKEEVVDGFNSAISVDEFAQFLNDSGLM